MTGRILLKPASEMRFIKNVRRATLSLYSTALAAIFIGVVVMFIGPYGAGGVMSAVGVAIRYLGMRCVAGCGRIGASGAPYQRNDMVHRTCIAVGFGLGLFYWVCGTAARSSGDDAVQWQFAKGERLQYRVAHERDFTAGSWGVNPYSRLGDHMASGERGTGSRGNRGHS